MSDFLTTRELAALLRIKERKVYDLVAAGSVPVRKVTGKLLFPRREIEAWIGADTGMAAPEEPHGGSEEQRPLVIAGGHDPLLEWALRESRSGIAAFFDGALDGLSRAVDGGCMAVALHIPEPGGGWNVATVETRFGREPWVLIEWVKRARGLVFAPDLERRLGRRPSGLADVRGLRFQHRQPEAGSELVLDSLLRDAKLKRSHLLPAPTVERSESDLAVAIATGRADVGLGIAAAARQYNLDFVPLVEERFDLLVWRKAYFDPPFQQFIAFCRQKSFAARARELGGYDISGFGTVQFNGAR